MGADFARDTTVTALPSAPGWYTADLPDSWSFRTPSGGVLMTIALRAMQAELRDPALIVRSANTLFCSPVPAGPLEIRVEVLRRGSAAAQMRAGLSSSKMPGPGLEVSATFALDRDGPELLDSTPRKGPRPEDAIPLGEPGDWAYFKNFEMRLAEGNEWWKPGWSASKEARFSRWIRYLEDPRGPDGALDPLALPPVVDLMPTALLQKLGPDHPRYFAPSLDLTVHFLEPARTPWILTSSHVRFARSGYASADVEVWDEDGRLAAFATQTMFLRRRRP
jgi:acyl-CoA thioesterase